MVSPGRSGLETPITPASRTTGTTGLSPRNRAGTSGRSAARTRSSEEGFGIVGVFTNLPVTHC